MNPFNFLQTGFWKVLGVIDFWMVERSRVGEVDGVAICDMVALDFPNSDFLKPTVETLELIREVRSEAISANSPADSFYRESSADFCRKLRTVRKDLQYRLWQMVFDRIPRVEYAFVCVPAGSRVDARIFIGERNCLRGRLSATHRKIVLLGGVSIRPES